MLPITKYLLLFSLILTPVCAQTATPSEQGGHSKTVGFLRLIHLAANGEDPLHFFVQGKDIFPEGYTLGQATGGMTYPQGILSIKASKKGCKTTTRKLPIHPQITTTLVAYSEPIRDEEGRIIEWQLRLTSLQQKDKAKGVSITLVSLCPDPILTVDITGLNKRAFIQQVSIPSRRIQTITLKKSQEYTRVIYNNKPLTFFSSDEPGNYVVMIYQDKEGNKKALSYYDLKFFLEAS